MTDSDRIRIIEKKYGLSTQALARKLNLKYAQTLYDIHRGKHGISKMLADKILCVFPELNRVWILTGEGHMLVAEKKVRMDSPVKRRLGELIEENCPDYDYFLHRTGFDEEFFDRIEDSIKKPDLKKIQKAFPDWDINYLMTGKAVLAGKINQIVSNYTPHGWMKMSAGLMSEELKRMIEENVLVPYQLVREKESAIDELKSQIAGQKKEIEQLKLKVKKKKRRV